MWNDDWAKRVLVLEDEVQRDARLTAFGNNM